MNTIIRKVFYLTPVQLRYSLRRLLYLPQDLFRKKHPLEPPKGMIFTGTGNYLETGRQFFSHFKKLGDITPQSHILDIGSGIGRMAVPFTEYLSAEGRYDGFDIVKQGVDWCIENITTRFPNFRFKLIPLRNELYNLETKEVASDLRFPYPDENFDFIFLTSVFTHMLPADVENYIAEINRVLKKGKKCLMTFFILDQESETAMLLKGEKKFRHHLGHYSLMDKSVKEANVAYQKEYILGLFKKNGFEITNFIRGNWSGLERGDDNQHQDIFIIKKTI
jgi:ubiquinone/menaquinone biosynthesis C-methylase UbiE